MIQQLVVFLENKPGRLERITGALSAAGANIRAIHVASLGEMGVVKLVASRVDEAFKALGEFGAVRKVPVLAVRVPDRPGALHQVTATLNKAGINIENASGFAISGSEAILILEVADVPAAERALTAAEFKVLDEGEFEGTVG